MAAFTDKRDPLLFKINTHIRHYIQCRPDSLACQVRLDVAQHRFMDHDRFIDCSEVIEEFRYSHLRSQLTDDLSRIKGQLSTQTRAEVVRVVEFAKTITLHHKRLIAQALQATP